MVSHGPLPPVDAGAGHAYGPSRCAKGDTVFKTRRERLRDLLFSTEDGLSLEQIEKILEVKRQVALADLEHLRLSFKHRDATLLMVPPSCTLCGYTFRLETPRAPSKCPSCKGRDLSEPIFKATAEA